MLYPLEDIGPALARLRKKARLTQEQVAAKINRSKASAAAIESPSANPQLASILRYLAAVDASFVDLHDEIGADDPVNHAIRLAEQRLEHEPGYRSSLKQKLDRFGTGSAPELEELKARVEALERRAAAEDLASGGDQPLASGTDD